MLNVRRSIMSVIVVMSVIIPIIALAQNLPCRTYGSTGSERAYSLVMSQSEDLGYVLAGMTTSFPVMPGDTNLLIVRIDSSGNRVGPAKISIGPLTEEARSMRRTADGGYVVTGWTRSYNFGAPPGPANIFVLKLGPNLNLQWGNVYGTQAEDKAFSVIQTSDGGYAVVGHTNWLGVNDVIVIKLTPAGVVVWTRIYGRIPNNFIEEGYGIAEIPGLGYAIVGRAVTSMIFPTFDAFVMLIDLMGNTIQNGMAIVNGSPTYFQDDEAYSVIYDGTNVVVAGWTKSYGIGAPASSNIFISKFTASPTGITLTPQTFWYGWEYEEKVMDDQSLIKTMDGGFAVSGWTYSQGPGAPNAPNFWILKTDNALTFQWSTIHPSQPGANFEQAFPMVQNSVNNNYAIAGWTNSFGVGGDDFHFLTLDPMGHRPVCVLDIPPIVGDVPWYRDSLRVSVEYVDYTTMLIVDTVVSSTSPCPIQVDTVDVGPTKIFFSVSSPFDSTANVTPSCSLYNYGNTTESYTVQMTIGSFWTGTYPVSNHASKTYVQADFISNTDWPRGQHSVQCITLLSNDGNRYNDTLNSSIVVHVHDVGTTTILYPTGNLDSVATFTPQAQVKNHGNVSENFNVKFSISASGSGSVDWFDDTTLTVTAGATRTINFAPWTVRPSGDYVTKCSTELTGDMDNTNDKQTGSFTVVGALSYNVGTVAIYAPTGEIDSTGTITPQAKVKNYGSSSETFNVKFTISGPAKDIWSDDTSVTLNPDEELTIDFEDWTVGPQGDYTAKCSTELATDLFAGNDKKEESFAITIVTITPGWAQVESITHADDVKVGKYVKDGGALTAIGNTIYAFHGNKSNRFYQYTPGTKGTWTSLDTLPYGYKPPELIKINKKKVGKGGSLCNDGGNVIYATKGNGTKEFWAYEMVSDLGWTAKAFVPVPKGLKGGTSIVYHDSKVYLLAGSQKKTDTANFFVYDVGTDAWSALADLELGPNTKVWKDGSCLTITEDTIYALKGGDKVNFFYVYNIGSNTWTASESIPRMDSLYGKWKKLTVKDGGAMTSGEGAIYALKGGGNNVFWKYSGGAWSRLESIPRLHKKSVPKTGAALAYANDAVWLLKGNNTPEYWRYTPYPKKVAKVTPITVNTLMNDRISIANKPIIDVIPNPFTNLTTIHYTVPVTGRASLKLFNAAGILIETIADEYLNAGTYTTTLSAKDLAQGIYFLRYEDKTNRSEIKLILE